jgi:hypothetical protein
VELEGARETRYGLLGKYKEVVVVLLGKHHASFAALHRLFSTKSIFKMKFLSTAAIMVASFINAVRGDCTNPLSPSHLDLH